MEEKRGQEQFGDLLDDVSLLVTVAVSVKLFIFALKVFSDGGRFMNSNH